MIRTLAELKALKGGEESTRGSRKDMATNSSMWTLLRDIIDSFDSIVQTEIDNNMSVAEILTIVTELEDHSHNYEVWMEKAAVPAGETNIADQIGTVGGLGAFQVDAGNNTWGAWVQILGSADTPVRTGKTQFDLHRIIVEAAERNETYYFQIGFGASGAAALAAEEIAEAVLEPLTNQVDSGPLVMRSEPADSGTKAWARCMCPGQDTATLDFYFGFDEFVH